MIVLASDDFTLLHISFSFSFIDNCKEIMWLYGGQFCLLFDSVHTHFLDFYMMWHVCEQMITREYCTLQLSEGNFLDNPPWFSHDLTTSSGLRFINNMTICCAVIAISHLLTLSEESISCEEQFVCVDTTQHTASPPFLSSSAEHIFF